MSRTSSASKIKLNSIESLFGENESCSKETVREIPLSELYSFKDHPFRVRDDEKMAETVESIKTYGVLVPGIVRERKGGGYEIISGHRRKRASEIAGLYSMPAFVRNLTDDEAIIIMVDSNIQREEISPSEKARAYKMKYDALKHQGSLGERRGKSLETMSLDSGESIRQIQRYICLAGLNDRLLEMVDMKKLGMAQGVDLSFLTENEQECILHEIQETGIVPNMKQSSKLKALSRAGNFDSMQIKTILSDRARNEKNILIKEERIRPFFPQEYTAEEITEVIMVLLEKWRKQKEDI